MSTKQESESDVAFKTWPFSSDINFASKSCQVTAATCKYYWPLIVSPTITNCCKELHLECGRILDLPLKTFPCTETSLVLCENQSFFLLFQNGATFIGSNFSVTFSVTFYSMMKYFRQAF